MARASGESSQLQAWLQRFQAGDPEALAELIGHSLERLRKMARKMLRSFPNVRRWEETDDVLHNAVLRLQRSLSQLRVESVRQYLGLAALHIKRELLDLARRHFGPQGAGAHHASGSAEPVGRASSVLPLQEWEEFHRQVELLPPEERDVFSLLWYHGLTQQDAAELLGESERTVRRRWRAGLLRLHEALRDADSALLLGEGGIEHAD